MRLASLSLLPLSPAHLSTHQVDPDAAMRKCREKLAPYLEQFAHYFSADYALERLASHICKDDRLSRLADTVLAERQGGGGKGSAQQPSIRDLFFECDDDTFEYTFKPERALQFFRDIGVAKG